MADTNQLNGLLSQSVPLDGRMGLLGLAPVNSLRSVAPFGLRHDSGDPKGKGYFGMLSAPSYGLGGVSTEISATEDIGGKQMEFPLLAPGLSRLQINSLLAGQQPTEEIYRNALAHAIRRAQLGLSPFAAPNELRYPLPEY